jgi:hypothetical protein
VAPGAGGGIRAHGTACGAPAAAGGGVRGLGDCVAQIENEYRLDAELPAELQRRWAAVKVTDRMPFRLILQSPKPLQ